MNIYDFAIDFEQENKDYYEECAKQTRDSNLKRIFNYLAKEERRHEEIVKKLKQEEEVAEIESDILPKAAEVFKEIAKDISVNSEKPVQEDVNLYRKAVEMERSSYNFYQQKAEEVDNPVIQEAFLKLAKEEKRHEIIMDNIVEHLERPLNWIEDAEFNHLDEY
ncbi:rubrerythrin [Orenia metallireducens]|uniref:Rubrerythrin n=1 Tax=Orenia metallireducens TaxID=1413210 RepID=A0A285FYC1_9FIRM|nr:ferritin family protein [Orenia metallireducens]PRX35549.1 rubrerythrin [Orenia metallireducens]SNY16093.1 Rubrerythrin [Orenia metallireducens]